MIRVYNVWKKFKFYRKPSDRLKEIILRRKYHSEFWALQGISFEIKKGEVLGIIGPNGAGKSTLLKILTGVVIPDKGKVEKNGRVVGLIELGTGFNYELTGLENIYLNATLLGLSKNEINERLKNIIDFSELGDFIYRPLKTYSSGMIMRLAFSIAIHTNPECLIIDEALTVGDAHFQQKSFKKLKDFIKEGKSIIFVSHDMNSIKVFCNRAILLHKGKIVDEGDPQKVVRSYNRLIAIVEKENIKVFSSKRGGSYGTFEAIIEKVSIKGVESGTNIISSGENAVVEVKVRSFKKLDNVVAGILIRDRFGQDIFGVNTYYLRKKVSFERNGKYILRFEFPLNIGVGRYTLTVALHRGIFHSETCYHWIDNVCFFEVTGFKNEIFVGLAYLPTDFYLEKIS